MRIYDCNYKRYETQRLLRYIFDCKEGNISITHKKKILSSPKRSIAPRYMHPHLWSKQKKINYRKGKKSCTAFVSKNAVIQISGEKVQNYKFLEDFCRSLGRQSTVLISRETKMKLNKRKPFYFLLYFLNLMKKIYKILWEFCALRLLPTWMK